LLDWKTKIVLSGANERRFQKKKGRLLVAVANARSGSLGKGVKKKVQCRGMEGKIKKYLLGAGEKRKNL